MTTRPAALAAIEAEQRRIKQAADRALSEREWQAKVINAAETFSWWVWHDYDSRRNRAGWPDLVLVRPGDLRNPTRIIFAELKAEKGRLSPEQRRWIDVLSGCPGVGVWVWRPSDWDDVIRILSA